MSGGKKIVHAVVNINGTEVFLNGALMFINNHFGNKEKSLYYGGAHLTVAYRTIKELLAWFEILKKNDNDINTFFETPNNKLCSNFTDRVGAL